MRLEEKIKASEGFRGTPYKDSEGIPTIGYGTKLPLSEAEAELLLRHRLSPTMAELHNRLPWLNDKPPELKEILYEMAYQMGVPRLMGFKKTLAFIKADEYEKAAVEMLDSRWYRQMHAADMLDGKDSENRAERLSKQMKEIRV